MSYDENNIFAKILRGEIPNKTVYEDDHVLAFEDIEPKRKHHILIIPKGQYMNMTDFAQNASDAEISGFIRAIPTVIDALGISRNGYRIISNCGEHGGQEVPHLHIHILGGEPVGPMIS